jgi:hypothetical protein
LYIALVKDTLKEYTYNPELAKLKYALSDCPIGLEI